MSARDVIARAVEDSSPDPQAHADYLVAELSAAGCRILGPDEIAPVWAAMLSMVKDIHAAQDNLSTAEWSLAERVYADLTKIMDSRKEASHDLG